MKKMALWAAVPLLGGLLLSGCANPGATAAVVNGVSIPDSRVVSFAEGCSAVLSEVPTMAQTPNELRSQMVKWAVLDEMSRQYEQSQGDGPTRAELRDYVSSAGLDLLLTDERCEQATLGVARHDLIALSLGSDMTDYFGAFDVELNPRYGHWDAQRLEASGSGSLSDLAS